jgi:hypothetical protein
MEATGVGLIVAGAVAVVGGLIYLGWKLDNKRTDAFRVAAATMGFAFEDRVDDPAHRWGELPLFNRGHSRKARRVCAGELAGAPAMVMDFQYTISSGKNSHTHHQTVALFPEAGRDLPDFELAPEHFLHRLGQVFGYQDIDFEQFPEFSRRYLLRGADEEGIRRVFTPTVLGALEQNPGWSVQARDGTLCAFRAGRRCKPEELPVFLAEALRIVSALGVKR